VPGRQVSSVCSCLELLLTETGNKLLLIIATENWHRFRAKNEVKS